MFIPDGLVAKYRFHGLPVQRRGTIIDESGLSNNGTVYGVPALSFDGASDVATPGTLWDALSGHRYAIFAGWVLVTAAATIRTIYAENWNGSAEHRYQILIDSSDKLRIRTKAGASGDTDCVSISTSAITEGVWFSLLAMVDLQASPFAPSVWIDGAAFAMGNFSAAASQTTYAANVPTVQRFGATTGDDDWFNGRLQWLGYGGRDTPVTIADAVAFQDFPKIWLDGCGLDAWYYCKEGSGGVDNAEGTATRDLTLTGAIWNVQANGGDTNTNSAGAGDSFSGARRWFEGTDDYVQITDVANLRFGTAPYQVHVWAAIAADAVNGTSIAAKGSNAAGEWQMFLASGANAGKLRFYALDSGGVNFISIVGGNSLKDGALHLLSVLRNGNDVYTYVDGVQIGTGSNAVNLDTTKALQIMAAEAAGFCKGSVYSVLVGTANKTIAQAIADMVAIKNQGAFV